MANTISQIPVQVFAQYVIEKLRKSNPFLQYAVDESDKVLGGAVLHIPQAGESPRVVKNRKVFPATAVMRSDSFITMALNVFSTDPTHITWHESNEISYDKTDSVLGDHVETLMEAVGDEILYSWAVGILANGNDNVIPVTSIIRTSGESIDATEEGQTGKRLALTYKELQKAQALMNKQNTPKNDRYLLIESYMLQQLTDSLSSNQMAAFQQTADLANGVVGKLAGFKIMERSTVLKFTAEGVPMAPGAEIAATTNIAALAWQKDCVSKAIGDIKAFQDIDNPEYYGNIFSALVKAGGRCRRADWKGVIAIVQSAVAEPENDAEPAGDAEPETPTISGANAITAAATSGSNVRTYATSNGAGVTASTDADWLSVSASGNQVTFTRTAYDYSTEGSDPRVANVTVGIEDTDVSMTVTVSQAMGANPEAQ